MCFNVALLLKAKDCDRVFVGGDPVNAVDPWGLATYGSVEAHAVLGFGDIQIRCCDESGNERMVEYRKICVGVALGGAVSAGATSGDGKACSDPPKYLLGVEIGGAFGLGLEAGFNVGTNGSGMGCSGGGGGGVGYDAKVTACFYVLWDQWDTGECCE